MRDLHVQSMTNVSRKCHNNDVLVTNILILISPHASVSHIIIIIIFISPNCYYLNSLNEICLEPVQSLAFLYS